MDTIFPHSHTKPPNHRIHISDQGETDNDPYVLSNTAAFTSADEGQQNDAQPQVQLPSMSQPPHAEQSGKNEVTQNSTDPRTYSHEHNDMNRADNIRKPVSSSSAAKMSNSRSGLGHLATIVWLIQTAGAGLSDSFDAYGAELNRDARFWKVYVAEADKFDQEAVDGWNKSLDVILVGDIDWTGINDCIGTVFAALFSAVSTAFIIESSKRLEPDPTEVVNDTLLAISQTLKAMAGNAQVDAQAGLPDSNTTPPFVPTHTSVIVNTLWYLSLSLSIATSLIAMLAKDWCRSFLANRTGDPYTQSQVRQRKWTMIERWKMKELLMVLPSLIHLSLLLFAVGLCISVWELNSTVAVPVICVTGVAVLFYVWSSIAASFLESFPYTTIISTINRTGFMRRLYRAIAITSLMLLLPVGEALLILIFILMLPYFYVDKHSDISWETLIAPPTRLFGCLTTTLTILWKQVKSLCRWYQDALEVEPILRYIMKSIRGSRETDNQITGRALKWLIETCENPHSISIGLQAISGAISSLSLQPLQDCDAAKRILRILTSSSSKFDSAQVIGKYSRALKFLARTDDDAEQSDTRDKLRERIGDWQAENEVSILGLVTDPNHPLEPDERNLTALRTGSIAPSYALQLLYEDPGADAMLPDQINLLFGGSLKLHLAAQAALFRGAALISAALPPGSRTSRGFAESRLRLISNLELLANGNGVPSATSEFPRILLHVQCIAALDQPTMEFPSSQDSSLSPPDPSIRHTRLGYVLDVLRRDPQQILAESVVRGSEILCKARQYPQDQSDIIRFPSKVLEQLSTYFQVNIDQVEAGLANTYFRAIYDTYDGTPNPTPPVSTYISMALLFCRELDGLYEYEFSSAITCLSFPQISDELVTQLDERKLIPRLIATEKASNRRGHFAATQLWLLHALLGNLPRSEYSPLQGRLWDLLHPATEPGTDAQEARQIRQGLAKRILRDGKNGTYLFPYTYRIAECIFEIRDYEGPEYDSVRQGIPMWLSRPLATLRGVSSFTPDIWPPTTPLQSPAEQQTTLPAPGDARIDIGAYSPPRHAPARMFQTDASTSDSADTPAGARP